MTFASTFKAMVFKDIHREGINDLMDWLEKSDFFTAPASIRWHGNYEGGLVEHSLNVYDQLRLLTNLYGCDASEESIAIVSLFHDLCKVGCYKEITRWQKNEEQKWESYKSYKFEEDFPYGGHGAKSVFLVQSFMKLTPEEAAAINCHMGQHDATQYSNPSAVYSRNKLAWLLHVADEAATYICENPKQGF